MTQSRKHDVKDDGRIGGAGGIYRSRPHDIHNLYVSLKQWRIFHAVVDCGGFAEAAKYLHLSQSTISYTVSKLQDQLGTPLLRIEGRKANLTSEGRALLERSRHVLKEAIELENFARNLGQGWGGDIRLVVDHNFPTQMLMQAVGKFSEVVNGASQVKLNEVPVLNADDVLRDPTVDLAISERVPLGFLGEPLIEVEYIPVAHPEHPLLGLGRDINAADLIQQTQICVGHAGERDRNNRGIPKQERRWNMSSLDTVVWAVRERMGYAWLPQHRIQKWLDEGSMVLLPLAGKQKHKSMYYLIHGRPWAACPGVGRLAEVLRGVVASHTVGGCAPPQ